MRSRLLPRELNLDFNYLYDRRGRALLMAANAACDRSRAAHLALARAYRDRIDGLRTPQCSFQQG
jgi:hypothetical protein